MAAQAHLRRAYKFKYQSLNKRITIELICYINLVSFCWYIIPAWKEKSHPFETTN